MSQQHQHQPGKLKSYAIDQKHRAEIITRNGQVEKLEQWLQVGINQATRSGTAIRQAERLLPGQAVRVRLLTSGFTWRTFGLSVTNPQAETLAAVLRFSKEAA